MKFSRRGNAIMSIEVRDISTRGFWLSLGDRDLFVPFKSFPWFRAFTRAELADVERPSAEHIRWPRFDIDLEVESIEHPDLFPLLERRLRGTPATVVERLRAEQELERRTPPRRTSKRGRVRA